MEFYTIVNAAGKFIVPAFEGNSDEPTWKESQKPCLFDSFYDSVEKVREFHWSDFTNLDWSGTGMRRIRIVTC